MLRAFKNRRLKRWQPVEVYRNLHHGGYSVRQHGRVVAHADALMLKDAVFVMQPAGARRALRTGVRNVHAWIRGRVTPSCMGTNAADPRHMVPVKYVLGRGFFHNLVRNPRPLRGALCVKLRADGVSCAYCF